MRCDILQNSLQALLSPRSSLEARTKALNSLERLFASVAIPDQAEPELFDFLALQDTFECNISTHVLAWIATSTPRLELLASKSSSDHERGSEARVLSAQLVTGLCLLQGVVLNHSSSKSYLGQKHALEVMIELLLVSRHFSSSSGGATPTGNRSDLTSVVLDTLLCILVDLPCALRRFEETNGVQAVVKILKRAGTPRQVRMKCLEFLYFYLLDERSTESSTPERHTETDTMTNTSWPSSSFDTESSGSWDTISSITDAELERSIGDGKRSTEEKMSVLGSMLGNVEALVECMGIILKRE